MKLKKRLLKKMSEGDDEAVITDGELDKIREKAVKNLETVPRKSSLSHPGDPVEDKRRKSSFVRFDDHTEFIQRLANAEKDCQQDEETFSESGTPVSTPTSGSNSPPFKSKLTWTDSLKVRRKSQ